MKNNEWFYWPPKNKFNYENGKYVKWLLPKECKFVFWTTVIDKKNLCDSKHDWLYKMWLAHYLNSYRVDENPLMPLSAKPEEE